MPVMLRPFLAALLLAGYCSSLLHGQTIRGKVIDVQRKAPLPCRLYVQASDGSWKFATSADPAGTALKYSVERGPKSFEKHVTLSAHGFTVDVPTGKTTL